MKIKKFNGFDKNGYLPYGMYNITFEEFKRIFCANTSKRKEICKEYQKHLSELKNTGYFLDHWIGGSFVTNKKDPSDIDTLTEFDGEKVDANNNRQKINDLINNSKSRTTGLCHSLRIYRYSHFDKEKYNAYPTAKLRILIEIFGSDREEISKGVVHLIKVKI